MTGKPETLQNGTVGAERMLAFLADPRSYPHRPASVDVTQTHISYVALAGDLVFKVKKPVDFGFLDFTRLESRRHFCHRETELNRRLCHDIYLGVVPIVDRAGQLAFGHPDAEDGVVDYAVKMRRLGDRYFLSNPLGQSKVGRGEIDRIVEHLLPFYRDQRAGPETVDAGSPARVREIVVGNLDACEGYAGDLLSADTYEALRRFSQGFLEQKEKLLEARVAAGRIKDCHGDLRPEHIHLGPDRVCIYDCIEFNDRLRYIDIAADVAFLTMALGFCGRWDLSRYFVRRMADVLNDDGLLDVIDFYRCYRAAVRGKVAALTAEEPEVSAEARDKSRATSTAYFRLALRFALFGSAPTVVAVMGRVGTGKTTLASALADDLGCAVFSSDRIRKESAGLPLHERPSATERKKLYTKAMSEKTYNRLNELASKEVEAGRCAVLDATFGRRPYRDQLLATAKRSRANCILAVATAPDAVAIQRLREREMRNDVISDARVEDFDMLGGRFEPPAELSAAQVIEVDTTGRVDRPLHGLYGQLIETRLQSDARS